MPTKADLRELPMYGIGEAAHYLRIPRQTLRSWIIGRPYGTKTGPRFFRPLISVPTSKPFLLSFINLVEAHVLGSIRRQHKLRLSAARKATDNLRKKYGTEHPLASQDFETDGKDLFIQQYDELINISNEGQMVLKEIMIAYLKRIRRDSHGIPMKLYPFVRTNLQAPPEEPEIIVIDPYISFGRPTIEDTGVPTAPIAERYRAGEAIEDLAVDYGLTQDKIQEALRAEWAA